MRGRRPASQETCRQSWSHAKRAGRGVLVVVETLVQVRDRRDFIRGDVPLPSPEVACPFVQLPERSRPFQASSLLPWRRQPQRRAE